MEAFKTVREVVDAVRTGAVDAKASVSLTCVDAEGKKVVVKANGLPAGDVREPETWADAAFRGVDVSSKEKVKGSETASVPLKVSGFYGSQASAFVRGLLGVPRPTGNAGESGTAETNRVRDHVNGNGKAKTAK